MPVTVNRYVHGLDDPIVFVSRKLQPNGSIYAAANQTNDQPGVGPHSRYRPAIPGQLLVYEAGAIRTLVDGAHPTPASLNLVDVDAPDVSYDAHQIVFAGLPQGSYAAQPDTNPGAWRLYIINPDGTGLHALTVSDQTLDLTQFGAAAGGLGVYDDTDPAWLPDGRVVFSSTRWPSYAQYSGARTSNLYVVNADGTQMHRITAERNGANRPLVDPVTGQIVFARWWRNQRFPIDSLATITDSTGYTQKDGLTQDRTNPVGGASMFRNAWQIAAINPDGTHLHMWSGTYRDESENHWYGGAFTPDGRLVANYFPMYNMTEAAGFGGLRLYQRGAQNYTPLTGITSLTLNYAFNNSFGIFVSPTGYATEPEVMPAGMILYSWAPDPQQDYGLYMTNANGAGRTLVYDRPGTSELRARAIRPRPVPPIIADTVTTTASLLPPKYGANCGAVACPNDIFQDGSFTFDAWNVYFNGPVDMPIVNAPAIGSAKVIRFYLDHQRTSPGSFPSLDWPILLGEAGISPAGAVSQTAPANVPLFEQLRSVAGATPANSGYVPVTTGPNGQEVNGAAHVAGMNFGRPGAVVTCVGCHAGHSLIPLPADRAAAQWSNLAPGALVTVSSSRDPSLNTGLIDRRVLLGEIWRYWNSAPGQPAAGQWARLNFPVPITVRTVRLYNPRFGDDANSSLQVSNATVTLCADSACATPLASQTVAANLAVSGTAVTFADVANVAAVKVTVNAISGTFYGMAIASLAEIEVVAHGQ